MQDTRMVRLLTVQSTFHARVVAARLGVDGIVTELRGNVDGPYPVGDVHVYVDRVDLPVAQELLLTDEVEDALSGEDDLGVSRARAPWIVAAATVVIAATAFARHL